MTRRTFGRHGAHCEEPDLLVVALRGDLGLDEACALAEYIVEEASRRRRVVVLADLKECGEIRADARRALAERTADVPYLGIAVHGASFPTRLLAKLIVSAMVLYADAERDNPLCFFETEAEARDWINARRWGEIEEAPSERTERRSAITVRPGRPSGGPESPEQLSS